MERWLGSLAPFFLFLWGCCHSKGTEKGAGIGLPVGLFLFQLEGLPCLRTGGSGQWMQSYRHVRSSGQGPCSFRDSSLPLLRSPVSFTTFRVCLPRTPALRQVLLGYACGRCLRITLNPGPGFPVVSSYWSSRLMDWHPVIVSSHLDGCVSLALLRMVTVASVLSQSESRLFLLPWT